MSKKHTGNFDVRKSALARDQKKTEQHSKIFRLDDLQKKKKQMEEIKHIKAILDMVRHYK